MMAGMRETGGYRRTAWVTAGSAGISAFAAAVVWRLWGGETVGVVASVVSMVAGVVALGLAWAALRGTGGPAELTPVGMADQLAVAVRRQWEAELKLRRVNDPYTIPVRWEPADPALVAN